MVVNRGDTRKSLLPNKEIYIIMTALYDWRRNNVEHHVEYNVYEPNRLGKRARAVRFLILSVTIQNPGKIYKIDSLCLHIRNYF